MQDPVDEKPGLDPLEINPVILGAVAVKMTTGPVKFTEFFPVGRVEILGQKIKLAQNLELKNLGQMEPAALRSLKTIWNTRRS